MRSRANQRDEAQVELFRTELIRIIDPGHEMARLTDVIDWKNFDSCFEDMWADNNGRPAIDTRWMVSMHYLKYTFDLSDEDVVEAWLQNPYWQYLSGMRYFQHDKPFDPSSMSRWRSRVGKAGLEELLSETIRAGLKLKAVKPSQLQRVNVDTTVEEKHVRYPTDSRLYDRARERLVRLSEDLGIKLRQTYVRVGKNTLKQQGRYAHARQFKRARKCQKKLRTLLGRVIRDVERQVAKEAYTLASPRDELRLEELTQLLERAKRIHAQQRTDKNKIYSVHAPEVECISKGKVHKRYEFGVKASIATTSKGGWHVGAISLPGNPYDGHSLEECVNQIERISPQKPEMIFTDQGYRGHGMQRDGITVHVDKKRRGKTSRRLWKWMKRRSAVEPGIGHLKQEHRLNRNRLAGAEGDMANVILSASGMNFHKLLRHLRAFWLSIYQGFGTSNLAFIRRITCA